MRSRTWTGWMAMATLMAQFLAINVGASPSAVAHGYKRKSIEIVHPWTSENAEAQTRDAIVGMEIKLSGRQGDRLIAAESAVAERVEIRSGTDRPAPEGLALAPGKPVDLSRNGPHIRLIGLRKALVAYDTLPVTLFFRNAGRVSVDVLVEESTAARRP